MDHYIMHYMYITQFYTIIYMILYMTNYILLHEKKEILHALLLGFTWYYMPHYCISAYYMTIYMKFVKAWILH